MDWAWFRDRKRALNLTDAQIAEAAGKERSVVTKILKGSGTFSHDRADELARLFTVTRFEMLHRIGVLSASDLAKIENDMAGRSAAAGDDVVEIISLDLSVSMGPGTMIDGFVEEDVVKMGLPLVQSVTRTPTDCLRLISGIGDSMEPTLRTRDRIMVDINERQLTRINGIYWIDHLGLHGIKRLRAAGRDRVMIASDNPLVPDFEVPADEVRIHGRVIWLWREL